MITTILLILLSGILGYLAYHFKAVNPRGAICGTVIAVIISISGGWKFFVLLTGFVVFGALFAKLPHQFSETTNQLSARNCFQILATTGVSALSLLLSIGFVKDAILQRGFLLASLTALATSFSDTMSAEIGGRYGGTPKKLLFGKMLERGESGGMTWLGVAVGAISAFAFFYFVKQIHIVPLEKESNLAMLAFLGNLLDSILGALVQNRYQCKVCKVITENSHHCNQRCVQQSGLGLTNTGVNAISTLCIGILTFWLYT
ncbi:MAG: DUF92 domain-containing protein [bacterium]|nr:DUF92 domain-containing protein [bacterium]